MSDSYHIPMDSLQRAYQEKLEAQKREWQAKLELLKAKSEKMEGKAKIAFLEQIKRIQEASDSLSAKQKAMQGEGGSWDRFKQEVDKLVQDIKTKFERMK